MTTIPEPVLVDRWGASASETASTFACDRFLGHPTWVAWRAVTVDAAPDLVWAWLIQVRLAPYSYDWVDNLGRRSPRTLHRLDDPVPGSHFSSVGGRPVGTVVAVERERQLTGHILGTYMSFRLDRVTRTRTRLVLKVSGQAPRPLAHLMSVCDLVMARRQLLNFKTFAEASEAQREGMMR